MKNNYNIPVLVTCYVLVPKEDTNKNPVLAIEQGVANLPVAPPTVALVPQDMKVKLGDANVFRELWRVLKKRNFYIYPGKQKSLKTFRTGFDYDPSLTDSHGDTYNVTNRSTSILFNIKGAFGQIVRPSFHPTLHSLQVLSISLSTLPSRRNTRQEATSRLYLSKTIWLLQLTPS